MATREMLQFMSIPAAVEAGPSQKSYEEVRVEDYLLSYQSTGKPPLPCPPEPVNSQERMARGLPPLFQPTLTPAVPPADEKDLPEWQQFTVTKVSTGVGATMDNLQSITASEPYASFSFEQLRVQAYLAGRVNPPPTILAEPAPVASSSTLQSNGIQYGGNTNETFISISSKPDYALHSFEELRIASMKANGRDVTSKEIMGVAPAPNSAASLPISSGIFPAPPSNASPATPSAPSSSSPFSFAPTIRF
ncbi:hypothetical protein BDP27DRAFT_1417929 [Rhodocollybia butyracea]|uniref:Uncharacterized protein n=1 Tax=Rhodocollybia butyracea TaxID=206335 RepID=A0A9P5Q1Z4_9AGAR|nr:hypothetical protein BDP27DRAFT_1417929 [Rhodocollybia butyracea]